MKKKIFYWSPGFVKIATFQAVINSAYSINKYSNEYESSIFNFFGEFNNYSKDIVNKNLKLIDLYNDKFLKYLPKFGKLQSRISFIVLFLLAFFPLKKKLKDENPEFLIFHLITSLPLTLLILFNFKTKFILRISGYPKLGFFRKLLWKIALKKVYAVTCPTKMTMNMLIDMNIVSKDKIFLLYDPIIEIKKLKEIKRDKIDKDYFIAVGRLTKQKNFLFLCECIHLIKKKYYKNIKLLIAGNGEEKFKIEKIIRQNDLSDNIKLIGYKENIYDYLFGSKGFILSSLWEDPGFVLLEAAACRTFIISSDCNNGPKEIIEDNKSGLLFNSNNKSDFLKTFVEFLNMSKDKKNKKKINALKKVKLFTIMNHFQRLSKILVK